MGPKAALSILLLVFFAYKVKKALDPPPLPVLDEEKWWGPATPFNLNKQIMPFNFTVSEKKVIDPFRYKLAHHREFPEPLEGIQQQYGITRHVVEKFMKYWLEEYNWKEREAYINKYQQFRTQIQGLYITYVHVKPENPGNKKVLPILLLHGWPESAYSFYEVIPHLVTPDESRDFVFEVIAPNIPGFGTSQAASKPGLGPSAIAVILKNFMARLGFTKFYAQGGDFGAIILQSMAVLYPELFLGYHSNFCYVGTPWSYIKAVLASVYPKWVISDEEAIGRLYPLSSSIERKIRENGYLHLQATKPDTLGIVLNESPTALAAYILEKYTTATNMSWHALDDGGLPGPFSIDALLDNIMIYWITGSITTSMRLYAETFNKEEMSKGVLRQPVYVPTACARFSHEIQYPADGFLHEVFRNLVQVTDHQGGHFAALQLPDVLAKDVIAAVEKMEKLYAT